MREKLTVQEYVTRQCQQGLTLAEHAAATIDWHLGEFSLIHYDRPQPIGATAKDDFSSGRVSSGINLLTGEALKNVVGSTSVLVDHITSRYGAAVGAQPRFLIGEDELMFGLDVPTDTFAVGLYGTEMYAVNDDLSDAETTRSCIDNCDAQYRNVGFIVARSFVRSEKRGERIVDVDEKTLIDYAKGIVMMYAMVFDDEGYIVWEKKGT